MARLTFKQFIKEKTDFVPDPMEVLPARQIPEIDKQTGQPTGKMIDNPEREKQKQQDFWKFTRSSQLTPEFQKPEETKIVPDETLKVVASGGGAKKSTLSRIGRPKTNLDFLGVYGHYYPGPEQLGQIQRSPSLDR